MILKIDTTNSQNISVALLEPKSVSLSELTENQKLGSQVLLPLIDKILKDNKKSLKEITAIQVNPGPGSFTGTRVGVAIANALAFALKIPINGKKGKIVIPIYEKSKFD